MKPRITRERDPETGQIVERFRSRGPRVEQRVIDQGSDAHPELRPQVETTETYSAEEISEWAEGLDGAGEAAKIDGVLVPDGGEFPRFSRLRERMAEAGYDVEALAERAALPALLIARLVDSGEVPADSHRESIEAVIPDAFPERHEPLSMAEQIQGSSSAPTAAGTTAETERADRSRRLDARRQAVAEAAHQRRQARDRRKAELDTGLRKILPRLAALQRRVDRL
jgi:hypothetical protein